MRRVLPLIAMLLVSAGVALAAPQSFTVRSVTVEAEGQWRDDPNGVQTAEQCRRFKLSPVIARRWFNRAREVTKEVWLEQLDWTQCFASGTLVTGDGKTYRWEIDQSGRANIVISPTVNVYLGGREIPFARKR